jgi:hypothetical protein
MRFSRCGEVKLRRKSARTPRRPGPEDDDVGDPLKARSPFGFGEDPLVASVRLGPPFVLGTARGP